MAGWWAEAEIGYCHGNCPEGTCGHCDSVVPKSKEIMMARENKAERLAREAKEQHEMVLQLEKEYPLKLMQVLSRAHRFDYEVVPVATATWLGFSILHLHGSDEGFRVGYTFSLENDHVLDEMTWTLDFIEEKELEEKRKREVRSAALAKLSDEEKKLLGL